MVVFITGFYIVLKIEKDGQPLFRHHTTILPRIKIAYQDSLTK